MNARRITLALLASLVAIGIACTRPTLSIGEGCEINSDCASPLICTLARCRRQCVNSRDCGAGLSCLVRAGSTSGGGCQLEHERQCNLTSECTPGLVCQNGTCTTMCASNRDCPASAMCTIDMAGVQACHDPITQLCIYDSDCPAPLVCGRDQLCHTECIGNRDCTFPRVCVASLCQLLDAGVAADGGP